MILRPFCFFCLLCWMESPALFGQQPGNEVAADQLQRRVRPILSDNCFHCHGPDKNTRMVDLRLDTREGAFAVRENGIPVVPGNPSASLLYQRITAKDPARRMPPEYSNRTLTPEQKEILKRWIEEGAPWKEHWSLVPPVRSEPPVIKTNVWVRNPIDRFILARLESAGLQPAPEADRRTLARRLSLDLRGLPPSPEEVEAFVSDQSGDAYERLVDLLMSSQQWGEHRARYWLDAARYADTNGIHLDNYREMWPYRDWVIQAFNRNLPFDRFTIEQLAGDLLPNPTLDQQVASGFHRCNVTTNEGGAIPEEFEAIYAKDRVDTTGTVWLGLTVGCATCHDHKFDPISTRDFYSLTAFFRNTTQQALDGNIPDTPPVIVVPSGEDLNRWAQLTRDEQSVKDRMHEIRGANSKAFDEWLNSERLRGLATPIEPSSKLLSLVVDSQARFLSRGKAHAVPLNEGVTLGEGPEPSGKALHFAAKAYVELPSIDYFTADRPFSIATWIYFPTGEDTFVVASQSDPNDENRGWTIEVGARVPLLRLTGDHGESIVVRAAFQEQLKPGTWNHLAFTYDGGREQNSLRFYLNGQTVPTQGGFVFQLKGEIRTQAPLRLGSDGKRYFQEGAVGDLCIYTRVITEQEAYLLFLLTGLDKAHSKPPQRLTVSERDGFHLYYLMTQDSGYRELTAKFKTFDAERREIRRRSAVTQVMEERVEGKPIARILFRGQYDQPREEVQPNVPAALPPMPTSYPRNRLGLAQWLVDPSNPLTARVTVNRFWQEIFGTGIVKTTEDFGSQGQTPTHPELLDWLAVEFRESGWDIKKFFKLMVTSSAYRQSASATKEKLQKDPDNRLLSRGPRFRMDGEMVRDYALAASDLLVPVIGGPSVKPYQPEGIWQAVAMPESNTRLYHRDSGYRLYRRSLYTFWKRSAPPASMEIFSAPTRETCTVRRERTNTPLQALVTMNDPQFVEAARHLAERAMLAAHGSIDREFDFIAARLLARNLAQKERDIAKRAYMDYVAYYNSHADDARKLLSVGESKANETLAPTDFAALTMVANQMMNLDEVLNK
jgi:hypothetical protein